MQRKAILAGVSAFALLVGSASVASAQDSAYADVYQSVYGNIAIDNGSTRTNNATDSFNDAAGIVQIQKNNGSSNSIGAADDIQVDMVSNNDLDADASVDQATFFNFSVADTGTRDNDITNSFNGFDGVATVQQNNGDNNVMGVATAVHSRFDDSGEDFGDVDQDVYVKGVTALQFGPGLFEGVVDNDQLRTNDITDSFTDSSGIASLQQNNGNANAIGAGNSVAVDVGGVDVDDDAGKNVSQHVKVVGKIPGSVVFDLNSDRSNTIVESFNGYDGIANVQQNNGDVNVMGIGNAVMANIGLNIEPQQNNDVDQGVKVKGKVGWAASFDVDLPGDPVDGARTNDINNSFGGASGIANVQQNNGSQNVMGIGNAVQANIDSFVDDLNGGDDVEQAAKTVGKSVGNWAESHGFGLDSDDGSHRRNDITDSFDGFSGIANVQQNNGDNNVIGSSNSVVASIRTDDVVDDVDGAYASTYAKVYDNVALDLIPDNLADDGTNRRNEINGSFNGAQGILNVQQNNGNNNVMGIANTVTANVENSGADSADDVNAHADATAYVVHNWAEADAFVDRDNVLNNSFNDAAGLVNVQQNNGDNNAMNSSTAVTASLNNDLADGFGDDSVSAATLSSTVAGNVSIIDATAEVGGFNNSITDSGNGFNGIAVIQQNNGNNNAIQSSINVSANSGIAGGNFLGGLNN